MGEEILQALYNEYYRGNTALYNCFIEQVDVVSRIDQTLQRMEYKDYYQRIGEAIGKVEKKAFYEGVKYMYAFMAGRGFLVGMDIPPELHRLFD